MSERGFYENIGDPTRRVAIIVTDYTANDPNNERMKIDVDNIKQMLRNLGFSKENIKELKKGIAWNAISKQITDNCTILPDEERELNLQNNGYIMAFNLTYKRSGYINGDSFRAGNTWYSSDRMRSNFVVNNLLEWATKPKLIFHQTPMRKENSNIVGSHTSITTDGGITIKEIPIDADIFESFSSDGAEDSYGDENGSFYIQALCSIINQHIKDGTIKNTTLNNIITDVQAKIHEKLGKIAPQTPHFKSTMTQEFIFP